jgi:signal transduction histidine kinase
MSLFRRRVWKETLSLLLDFPIGIAGFTVVVTGIATAGSLLITFVGLPLLTATLLLSRAWGRLELWRAAALLDTNLPAPPALKWEGGLVRRLIVPLRDGASWRAALYLVLALPAGIVTFTIAVTWWSVSLGALTLPAWAWALPHGGPEFGHVRPGDTYYWNRPWQLAVAAAAGLLLTLAAPFVIHATTYVNRALLQLLRRPRSDERIRQLEETRARSVDAAVEERRRIERDLHDGAQARLVALGLDLGLALEKMEHDPEAARELVGSAHRETQHAIAELRDLVRGFAPAVLEDRGLDAALSALASRSPVPVEVTIDVPERQPASIEASAYFIVAEALTNVARHADAHSARVLVRRAGETLWIQVADDGVGDADAGRGTGLTGLAARAEAIDGTFTLTSPPGAGTTITVELPCAS